MAEHSVPELPAPEGARSVTSPLSACPLCGSRLVQLVDAEPHPPGGWNALLECPECWAVMDEWMDDDAIEAFDHAFDDGVRSLVDELRRLTAEHMREEVERFACALQAGAILPEDF
jgi:hypothetical protein